MNALRIFIAAAIICGAACEDIEKCGGDFDCVERCLVAEIDGLEAQRDVELLGGAVTLRRTGGDAGRSGGDGDGDILEKLYRFLSGREISLRFPPTFSAARKVLDEARSGKLKKFLVPFVALMILRKFIEVPIFLSVVSVLAFKGLLAGLVSLVLSGATAFKSLLEHGTSSKVSYEVVPQFASPHWSRSSAVGAEDYPAIPGYHTIENF